MLPVGILEITLRLRCGSGCFNDNNGKCRCFKVSFSVIDCVESSSLMLPMELVMGLGGFGFVVVVWWDI